MTGRVSNAPPLTASNPAAKTPATAPNASAMTAETLFGDYAWLNSVGGSGSRRNSGHATRRRNWPKRCERALVHYLSAQDGRSLVPDLASREVDGMAGPERSSVNFSADSYPRSFVDRLMPLKTQGA